MSAALAVASAEFAIARLESGSTTREAVCTALPAAPFIRLSMCEITRKRPVRTSTSTVRLQ